MSMRRMKKISFDYPPKYPDHYCWASEPNRNPHVKDERSHCHSRGIYRMPDGKLYCAAHVPVHPDAVRI